VPVYSLPITYTFNLGKLLSRVQIRQEGIFTESGCENAPALIEGNTATSVYWLDRMLWLKCRLVGRFVCHCAKQEFVDVKLEVGDGVVWREKRFRW
jgi:hypothetical protein